MEIVAELSCNHLGKLKRAITTIESAKGCGADAVKLQCWHPDLMVIDRTYVIPSGAWAGRNLYDLYQEAWTPWEWFPILFDKAREIGIDCFASVFDTEALSFLENMGCPRYKIASFEALDIPLVKAVADTGKPMIVSTGLMVEEDLERISYWGVARRLTLLKCISEYPATSWQYNLALLSTLGQYADKVGVSDHTLGKVVPAAAAALDCDMLEKHFTLNRADGGPDAAFSSEPKEFFEMMMMCRRVSRCRGIPEFTRPSDSALSLARSLYITAPLIKGETLYQEFVDAHVRSARPALGMSPNEIDNLTGKVVACDLPAGSQLTWGSLCDAHELAPSH